MSSRYYPVTKKDYQRSGVEATTSSTLKKDHQPPLTSEEATTSSDTPSKTKTTMNIDDYIVVREFGTTLKDKVIIIDETRSPIGNDDHMPNKYVDKLLLEIPSKVDSGKNLELAIMRIVHEVVADEKVNFLGIFAMWDPRTDAYTIANTIQIKNYLCKRLGLVRSRFKKFHANQGGSNTSLTTSNSGSGATAGAAGGLLGLLKPKQTAYAQQDPLKMPEKQKKQQKKQKPQEPAPRGRGREEQTAARTAARSKSRNARSKSRNRKKKIIEAVNEPIADLNIAPKSPTKQRPPTHIDTTVRPSYVVESSSHASGSNRGTGNGGGSATGGHGGSATGGGGNGGDPDMTDITLDSDGHPTSHFTIVERIAAIETQIGATIDVDDNGKVAVPLLERLARLERMILGNARKGELLKKRVIFLEENVF